MINFYKLLETIEQSGENAGAGALIIAQDTGRILIGFRSDQVTKPNLCWNNFGGKIEDSEDRSPEEGATREIIEETGYREKILKKVFLCKYPGEDKKVPYYNYAFVIKKEFHPELNEENSDYRWVTLDELLSIYPKHFGLNYVLENAASKLKNIIKKKDVVFLLDK